MNRKNILIDRFLVEGVGTITAQGNFTGEPTYEVCLDDVPVYRNIEFNRISIMFRVLKTCLAKIGGYAICEKCNEYVPDVKTYQFYYLETWHGPIIKSLCPVHFNDYALSKEILKFVEVDEEGNHITTMVEPAGC